MPTDMCLRDISIENQKRFLEIVKTDKCRDFYEDIPAVKPQFNHYIVSHSVQGKANF